MNLFGAATTGVDPQTGSYLSKEQRVAMFRASRGQGGSGSSAANSSGPRVKPQNSIVVVNKLTEITKTLETNFQSATNLGDQVAKNTKNINDIYEHINNVQKRDIKITKKEIQDKIRQQQTMRMRMREGLIEGVAGLAAASAAGANKIVEVAKKPVLGLLERIKNVLLSLAGAWLIRNMPAILAKLEDMFSDFNKTKREVAKQLLQQRGWAAGIEYFIRKLFGKITGTARLILRLTRFIGSKVSAVTGRIFNALKNFTGRVFGHILTSASRLFKDFLEQAKKLVPQKAKDFVRGIKNSSVGRAVGSIASGARRVFGGVKDIFSDVARGNFRSAVDRVTGGIGEAANALRKKAFDMAEKPLGAFRDSKGIKPLSNGARASGLAKILKPILKTLGVSAGAVTKLATPLLKRVPVIGTIIDIGLNKAGGMEWIDAIVRGIGSGIAGFTGGAAGMKAGAAIGFGVGGTMFPVLGAVPGSLIGGALGLLVGSMVGGAIGDGAGRMALEAGGRPQKDAELTEGTVDFVGNATGLYSPESDKPEAVKLNLPATFEGTKSTPEGMSTPDGFGSSFNINVTEMPTKTTKLTKDESAKATKVETPPALSATDSEMDHYRSLALTKYQLAF